MDNRSRKRDELSVQLPADKRVCSLSTEYRPGSSNSSVQTQINSASGSPDCEMEATSSSTSVSGRSEAEVEAEEEEDSDDMDDAEERHEAYQDYYRGRGRSSVDQGKIKNIAASLKEEAGPSSQLAGLTELCEVLSFSMEELPGSSSDLLAPVLVVLAKQEDNPDIMLLSIRCITYLCDVVPRSSWILVRHDVIPVLCARLIAIEYLDVAEQCLQALEKISRDHPLACLQAGVIMSALNYVDFFCTSIQRVALSTVANICKRLPSDHTPQLMEAVPILCNLLQYEDQKLVENVSNSLIKIVDRAKHSSEMLDEICKHGLINQATHLIALNGRSTLNQSVYTGLIGLLCTLASGSVAAVRTLLELNIGSTLKHILSSYELARGMPYFVAGGEPCNQVHEFMKLLNELLPPLTKNSEDAPGPSDKEKILVDQPELLQQFGANTLPVLIQVASSGVNLYVCYCCLSVISKVIYFSKRDMLIEFLKDTNISSFLAVTFTRKDHHVQILVLEIVENIMRKLPDVFLNSFIKEGVVYAIDALLIPKNSSESSSIQISSGSYQNSAKKNVVKCLCYAFAIKQSPSSTATCKLEENCVHTFAKRLKDSYFATDSHNSEIGLTETLQKLRSLCTLLIDKGDLSMNAGICLQQEENLSCIMNEIMTVLTAGEYMSTFEFIESGIVKSLVTYLSNGHYTKGKVDSHGSESSSSVLLKRLETIARFSLLPTGQSWESVPIAVLVRKLQKALSSLEDFSVILSHVPKSRNTYATIPFGRSTAVPSLKVHFAREEGEMDLCDYATAVVTVEPFSTLDDIETFLLPKVSTQRAEHCVKVVHQSTDTPKDLPAQGPSTPPSSTLAEDQNLPKDLPAQGPFTPPYTPPADDPNLSSDMTDLQEDKHNLSSPTSEGVVDVMQAIPSESDIYLGQTPATVKGDLQLSDVHTSPRAEDSANVASCSKDYDGSGSTTSTDGDVSSKLIFYLNGKQMDRQLTLYQAILQQKGKEEHEVVVGPGFWSEVYQITYRKSTKPMISSQTSSACDNHDLFGKIISMLVSELGCGLEKSDPTYEILFLLKILDGVNKFAFDLISHKQSLAQEFDDLVMVAATIPPTEFVNVKLTEKLEQQMRDPLSVSSGSMPSWWCQLMMTCSYLFGFEAKCKYFRQVMFSSLQAQPHLLTRSVNSNNSVSPTHRNGGLRRKKFQVCRSNILDSATKMMEQHAHEKATVEVEYSEEVGSGLGPTMEFYTLVSHEFQKLGLGMWRGDYTSLEESMIGDSGLVLAPLGVFPRPLSHALDSSNELKALEVMKKFVLLGQIVAKAIQDGRVLDLVFSKAFYKLILDQELNIYDIRTIDPELGRTLLEFQALADKKKVSNFRDTRVEDLWLDFTLPGYPDYALSSGDKHKMVNFNNLEEYVSSIVDATVISGISRQMEAFKSGFNQVFPIKNLQIFTEGELERLLCGEQDAWTSNELLEHIKFDHGYTASSQPILNLLEIIQDFDYDKKRAFLQFVTGAPRLPPGGLAALNPQLTVVRKHCNELVDGDLPSVMTCANYLKLPPYSSKERMRERLLYAITEGQGSFHLS